MGKNNGADVADDGALQLFNPAALKQLRDLSDAARREEAAEKREQTLLGLVDELKQAVADLVAHIEESDPKATADRLAGAIQELKFPAPQVTVNPQVAVQAPQVTLEATMPPMPAPVVHIMPAPDGDAEFTIRIKKAYGPDTVMTITRQASRGKQKE